MRRCAAPASGPATPSRIGAAELEWEPSRTADDAGTAQPQPPEPAVPGSVGILGGTFDPIHQATSAIAEVARDPLGLDRILFVPAACHRTSPAVRSPPAAERLAMVRLAIEGNQAFSVSDIEVDRGGPSYTVVTLDALA